MVRKLKEPGRTDENAMLEAVCGSAHQIWQAGLGAFAKAQQEGGDMFDKLVQEGVGLQQLTQRLAGEKGFSMSDTVSRLAESAGKQASGSWDKLEKIFEERVSRSLRSLGVPSQQQLDTLSESLRGEIVGLKAALDEAARRSQDNIDALGRGIAELKDVLGATGRKPAAKKTAARPSTKAVAKAALKTAPKKTAKAGPGAAAKAAAKRAPAKTPAGKKQGRSAASAS